MLDFDDFRSFHKKLDDVIVLLERLTPPQIQDPNFNRERHTLFQWQSFDRRFLAIETAALPLDQLIGIDEQKEKLLANTSAFAKGFDGLHALLWGARGTGKTSLIRSTIQSVNDTIARKDPIILIEIFKDDLNDLPLIVPLLKASDRRFILFCDDLSFEAQDLSYKALKVVLDGGMAGPAKNILFYATSNRRHLLKRDMAENLERATLYDNESLEEKLSLSDRFGLWIGFHAMSQEDYLVAVAGYVKGYGLDKAAPDYLEKAHRFAMERGARSGRTAWQFVQFLAAAQEKHLATK